MEDQARDVFIDYKQMRERYGVLPGPDALRVQERRGEFPPRRRIGGRKVAWLRSEVDAWAANVPTAEEKRVARKAARPAWAPKLGRPTKAMVAAREAARAAESGS